MKRLLCAGTEEKKKGFLEDKTKFVAVFSPLLLKPRSVCAGIQEEEQQPPGKKNGRKRRKGDLPFLQISNELINKKTKDKGRIQENEEEEDMMTNGGRRY
jgi:hypothetical protein